MRERSQKDVWRLLPWLTVSLLLGNFFLMAYDAKTSSEERMIRVWTQAVAKFVQSPVTSISSGISSYFSSLTSLRSAQTENEALKQRVQELEFEIQKKAGLSEENARLKGLLDLKNQSNYKVVAAQIIGRDPSAWYDTIIVSKGSLDGVKLNSPIVNDGGLIGRVTAVSPLTAQVTLITKSKAGLGGVIGELGSSNAVGVVTGSGKRDMLDMGYVPGNIPVQNGDIVYTTGQDGIYPPGLKIGQVVDIQTGSTTEPHKIIVEAGAKLYGMQEVAVLIYDAPQKPQYEKSVPNAVTEEKRKAGK